MVAIEIAGSLQQALFWMNLYRELLAADQQALRRMRSLVADYSGPPEQCAPDVQLVGNEIERVLDRLNYWQEAIDRLR